MTYAGYPCALQYLDTLNLGSPESGRDVYPCVSKQGEVGMQLQFGLHCSNYLQFIQVNELWTWNVRTYQWEFINTTHGTYAGSGIDNRSPVPREQHITAYVEGNLYVFGGKSHAYGEIEDTFYNDLWRLHIEHAFNAVLSGNDSKVSVEYFPIKIPQGQRLFIAINGSMSEYSNTFDPSTGIGSDRICINSLAVKVCVCFVGLYL